MTSSVRAKAASFDEGSFWVQLADGRTLGVPLAWFPRLLNASSHQLLAYRISPRGFHWDAFDEDISIEGLLRGIPDMTHRFQRAAE